MTGWELPTCAVFDGKSYAFHGDFRDILEIFSYFEDPDLPDYLKWQVALDLFYEEQIPESCRQEAIAFLAEFLRGGMQDKPGIKLLDWQQDAPLIVADVNKVAGTEIRSLPFLHWWSFLSWFHAIGQGQLSTVVAIRDKLHRGKPLEKWEKDFYREHKQMVDLPKRYSREELQQQEKLRQMLGE